MGNLIATYGHRAVLLAFVLMMAAKASPAGWKATASVFAILVAAAWLGWQARGEHDKGSNKQ